MDDWLPGLDDLGSSVRRIKENAETIATTLSQGRELLDDASEQMSKGKDLLDQNKKLLERVPRTLGIVEVVSGCIGVAVCLAVIKYIFFYLSYNTLLKSSIILDLLDHSRIQLPSGTTDAHDHDRNRIIITLIMDEMKGDKLLLSHETERRFIHVIRKFESWRGLLSV